MTTAPNPRSTRRDVADDESMASDRWPKLLPALTEEQERIRQDFHQYWLDLPELRSRFAMVHRAYFPLRVPIVGLNLMIGLTLTGLARVHV